MCNTAFKCICEWDALASSSNTSKDFEGLRLGPDSGCPKWMESDGEGYVFVVSAFFWHGNAFACFPNHLPAKEVADEERQGGGNSLPRCELSRDIVDIVRSIYQEDPKTQSYGLILNRQRCLVELGLMASKGSIITETCSDAAELDQGRRPRPTLVRLTKQRPKVLAPGSVEDTSQRKVIEDLSREGNREVVDASKVIEVDDVVEGEVPLSQKRKCTPLQRTLAVNTSGEIVLEGPSKSTQTSRGGNGGSYDSKRQFKELIGASGARIPDDALRNLPFHPTMGAQAIKKYFTPKWEEFSSHGELEDDAYARAEKTFAEASKSDKEHKQALEGLQATLDSARTAYEQMEADLKESDSNVLNLTKQLENANAAQKVAAEALEAANKEKRRLLEEAESRDEEISGLRKDLESSKNGRKEVEAGKREVEAKLANAKAEFMANFHNTEAYTNFSDYFARIGQQEVLTALRNDYPDFDIRSLEARFPPPDLEGEEDS
ncbi:putative abhydrolase domain-containing protein [Abeliophyllum distichum]|uniref:Abhydrolase domain-containing protein n=1 Tax=Abeliophyllum distichum TaxID=126358 RepID=A0ABD1SAC2_9LAMI